MRNPALLGIALLAACCLAAPVPSSAQGAPPSAPATLYVDSQGHSTVWTGQGQAPRRVQLKGRIFPFGDDKAMYDGVSGDGNVFVEYRVNDGSWVRYTGPFEVHPKGTTMRVEVRLFDTEYEDNRGAFTLEIR